MKVNKVFLLLGAILSTANARISYVDNDAKVRKSRIPVSKGFDTLEALTSTIQQVTALTNPALTNLHFEKSKLSEILALPDAFFSDIMSIEQLLQLLGNRRLANLFEPENLIGKSKGRAEEVLLIVIPFLKNLHINDLSAGKLNSLVGMLPTKLYNAIDPTIALFSQGFDMSLQGLANLFNLLPSNLAPLKLHPESKATIDKVLEEMLNFKDSPMLVFNIAEELSSLLVQVPALVPVLGDRLRQLTAGLEELTTSVASSMALDLSLSGNTSAMGDIMNAATSKTLVSDKVAGAIEGLVGTVDRVVGSVQGVLGAVVSATDHVEDAEAVDAPSTTEAAKVPQIAEADPALPVVEETAANVLTGVQPTEQVSSTEPNVLAHEPSPNVGNIVKSFTKVPKSTPALDGAADQAGDATKTADNVLNTVDGVIGGITSTLESTVQEAVQSVSFVGNILGGLAPKAKSKRTNPALDAKTPKPEIAQAVKTTNPRKSGSSKGKKQKAPQAPKRTREKETERQLRKIKKAQRKLDSLNGKPEA